MEDFDTLMFDTLRLIELLGYEKLYFRKAPEGVTKPGAQGPVEIKVQAFTLTFDPMNHCLGSGERAINALSDLNSRLREQLQAKSAQFLEEGSFIEQQLKINGGNP